MHLNVINASNRQPIQRERYPWRWVGVSTSSMLFNNIKGEIYSLGIYSTQVFSPFDIVPLESLIRGIKGYKRCKQELERLTTAFWWGKKIFDGLRIHSLLTGTVNVNARSFPISTCCASLGPRSRESTVFMVASEQDHVSNYIINPQRW